MNKCRFFLRNVAKTVAILAGFLKLRIVAIVACLAVFSANHVLAQTFNYTDASGVSWTYSVLGNTGSGESQEIHMSVITDLPISVTKWVIPDEITHEGQSIKVIGATAVIDNLPAHHIQNTTLREIVFPKYMRGISNNGDAFVVNNVPYDKVINLRKVTFGEALRTLGSRNFLNQALDSVIFKSDVFITTDPSYSPFAYCPATTKVIVPCGKLDAFVNHFNSNQGWWQYHNLDPASVSWTAANFYEDECLNTLTVLSGDVSLGNAISHSGDQIYGGSIFTTTSPVTPDRTTVAHTGKATLYAIAKSGNVFVKWDDNNTDNPRVVEVTEDVIYTAIFAKGEECEDCPTCPGTTGAGEFGAASSTAIQVYPNPADNLLQVELATSASGQLTLYDMSGKSVLTQSVSGTNAVLNIGSLASGSYILRLVENGVAGAGVKIIKN